jgi:hypothetical protein
MVWQNDLRTINISCLISVLATDAKGAAKTPDFFIGVDACRENLRTNSRSKLPNALFVIASAQALPQELNGLASHVTINFPWGSLLESLLGSEGSLASQFQYITRPFAGLDIHLNAEALVTAGWTLEGRGSDREPYECRRLEDKIALMDGRDGFEIFPNDMGETSRLRT